MLDGSPRLAQPAVTLDISAIETIRFTFEKIDRFLLRRLGANCKPSLAEILYLDCSLIKLPDNVDTSAGTDPNYIQFLPSYHGICLFFW